MKQKLITMALINFIMGAVAFAQELPTVDYVDLNKYMGRWYEIAAIPQSFQKKCVKDTTAVYSMAEENRLKVENSCVKSDGSLDVAIGRAKVVDSETNAKLKVTFAKIFGWSFLLGGKYWIVDLAPDYHYALVGHPNRKYAWVLSRTPHLSTQDLSSIDSKFKELGYDTCLILTSIQTGGFDQRVPLCKLN